MRSIRRATRADALELLRWKNDEVTRRFSLVSRELIAYADHLRWLESRLADPNTELNIILVDSKAAGDVRFDLGDETEVSIRLAPEFRGRGLATWAIGFTCSELCSRSSRLLVARIVKENIASLRAFVKCGFTIEQDCGEWWRLVRY